MSEGNGSVKIPLSDWREYREDATVAFERVSQTQSMIEEAITSAGKLGEGVFALGQVIRELKDGLLGPATGKDHIPAPMVKDLMDRLEKGQNKVMLALGLSNIVLLIVIGFLLTGEKFEWIRKLFGAG